MGTPKRCTADPGPCAHDDCGRFLLSIALEATGATRINHAEASAPGLLSRSCELDQPAPRCLLKQRLGWLSATRRLSIRTVSPKLCRDLAIRHAVVPNLGFEFQSLKLQPLHFVAVTDRILLCGAAQQFIHECVRIRALTDDIDHQTQHKHGRKDSNPCHDTLDPCAQRLSSSIRECLVSSKDASPELTPRGSSRQNSDLAAVAAASTSGAG
jgi:hypothetical protein